MKAVILAGGLGTRLGEETGLRPKPMVEIGGKPILWHIMKIYSHYGINEFILCLGYKGYMVKEYFQNYFLHMSDATINLQNNTKIVHNQAVEPWTVTVVDTGEDTMTGGRVRRIRNYLNGEPFCLTYGDGVGNVNIGATIEQHKKSGKLCTVTAVQPPGRFGAMVIDENQNVNRFEEKPRGDGTWINGGFFVVDPKVIDLVDDDSTIWEQKPLKTLAAEGQMTAYYHKDFWQPMDTLRDKRELEGLWDSGKAPWKLW